MRTLSANHTEAANAQQTARCWITLITISSDDLAAPLLICDVPHELLPIAQKRGVVSRGDEYIYIPFNIELPAQDDTGISRASLAIQNIDRQIITAIENITQSTRLKIEVVLDNAPDDVEISISGLKLERLTYDAQVVSGDISVRNLDREPFPYARVVPSKFPGAF